MTTAPVGRPRDEELTEKVLSTVHQLLQQNRYEDLSLVKIAEIAGVSRKALYSRWQHKCELAMDAFNLFHPPQLPEKNDNRRTQLIDYLEQLLQNINQNIPLYRAILADIQQHESSREKFEQQYQQQRRELPYHILQAGIQEGEFAEMDIEFVLDCLRAIQLQQILQSKPVERVFIEKMVALLIR